MDVDERALYRYIGRQLRAARTAAGLTQRQLAERLGVKRTSITNIETGQQRPPVHVLYHCCLILGIELAALLPSVQRVVVGDTDAHAVDAQLEHVPPQTAEVIRSLLRDWPQE